MQTKTTQTRLDALLRRVQHRAALDLALPVMTLVGIVMVGVSITGA